jgi:putative addiction module component (TIGR02574 family)
MGMHSLDDPEPGDAPEQIDAAWLRELQRRAASIEQGTDKGDTAEQVFAELRKKHGP